MTPRSSWSGPQITQASAVDLAAAIAGRQVSSRAVVEAFLERIARLDPQLNAVVQITADSAMARALQADATLDRGEIWGPLHGVPFTVKDVIDTAGVVSAAGLAERAAFVPTHDAVVVGRMKAAGAILLGKTNCPPGGGGGVTDNPVYGPTRHPLDPARSPGGSSGGEAAAIAAGMSPLGIGSDSGGSLRVPAHFCGIATLKPTSGRVPNTGVFNHPGGFSDYRTQLGPMARHVKDLALAFELIAGEDGHDAGVIPMPIEPYSTVDLRGLRVAVYCDDGITPTTAATAEAVHGAAKRLAAAGAAVQPARPPGLADVRAITERIWHLGDGSDPDAQRLLHDWDALRSRMLGFMVNHDLILCPVDAAPAPRVGEDRPGLFNYTLPYSLTGWPCVVVRAGTSEIGLPIGVQIVARAWHEHVALAVAACLETVW